MTDKIRPLFPGQATPGQPDQDTIDLLEHILGRAKAGEIINVAIAACTSDDSIVTCFELGRKAVTLIGAATHLLGRLERTMEL